MKNVSIMIGEHKFILDAVLATLAQQSGTAGPEYEYHQRLWTGQVEPWLE